MESTALDAVIVAFAGLSGFAAGLMIGLNYARRVAVELGRARRAVGRLLCDPEHYRELRSYAGFDR